MLMKNDRMINFFIIYNVNENVNWWVFFSDFVYNCINLFFVFQVVIVVFLGFFVLGRERFDEVVQFYLVRFEDDVFIFCFLNNLEIVFLIFIDLLVCFVGVS